MFAVRARKLGDLLAGLGVETGDRVGTFKQATRHKSDDGKQQSDLI